MFTRVCDLNTKKKFVRDLKSHSKKCWVVLTQFWVNDEPPKKRCVKNV